MGRGPTKELMHLKTQMNMCVALRKFKFNSTLEPNKQGTASQAAEAQNTGITPSHFSEVEQKVGTIGHSPSCEWIPHSPIPVRTIQVRVRQQTVLAKQLGILQIRHHSLKERQSRPVRPPPHLSSTLPKACQLSDQDTGDPN